jgi:hypothetical protein
LAEERAGAGDSRVQKPHPVFRFVDVTRDLEDVELALAARGLHGGDRGDRVGDRAAIARRSSLSVWSARSFSARGIGRSLRGSDGPRAPLS